MSTEALRDLTDRELEQVSGAALLRCFYHGKGEVKCAPGSDWTSPFVAGALKGVKAGAKK
jgi:hypothetical protein